MAPAAGWLAIFGALTHCLRLGLVFTHTTPTWVLHTSAGLADLARLCDLASIRAVRSATLAAMLAMRASWASGVHKGASLLSLYLGEG